ncbi:polysaccharide biosynthesis protein [Clostridium baratii]|uniref:PssD/Cps14F family polysaccharide biosynthesis glycosyltransferase n=1 Tax=Clostridium baratii TaxID=1561 RepID=UPI0009A27D5C|nr:PssD/Cps14F family polysaccharide biosynthesis glycosyltransferase [Clostridium baratii]OPF53059.1 polysaccharide biosynthesis protein [Clostridium baratii]OPF53719.1 polysaccharide biosynthesis protein [Clostridium baratii]OPF54431.1 polysaccharide biosynthesis protein [Clostridium baratii]OPF60903.1 polysaccharide biosynthesis protein [Clostridium baratii]
MKKVIFISSTGGHLSELMQLKRIFNNYDYHIITEKTDTTIKLKNEYGKRIDYLVYGARNYLFSYIFKFSYNIIKSFFLYLKIRPDVIVTTGAHTAVPICYIAKLFKKKIIFVESFARVNSKSMSGKMINKIADVFLVQHKELLDVYENSTYKGDLY